MAPLMMPVGELGEIIHELVLSYGGYCEAHTHLDRSGTLDPSVLKHFGSNPLDVVRLPLRVKQHIVGEVHQGPAYTVENLEKRIKCRLEMMRKTGTQKVLSFIDATPDIGMRAIEAAMRVRNFYLNEHGGTFTFEIAPHPIFGFKDDPERDDIVTRWNLFREACALPGVSAIGALPERDDRADSIGADEHFRRVLLLGHEFQKPVHIHVGQANDPREKNIFDMIEAVRWLKPPRIPTLDGPTVWAIHNISASAFPEWEFKKVLEGLKENNIGVIVCPRAALSMRQKRAVYAQTHNSIARVAEMLLAGLTLRLGSDNIADMFVPTGSGCMLQEVLFLADCIRVYDPHVLAKLAAGVVLNQNDLETVRRYLEEDVRTHISDDPRYEFCMDLN